MNYRTYILTVQTDRGIKTLKLSTNKDINRENIRMELAAQLKEFYECDEVEIVSINQDRFLSTIAI